MADAEESISITLRSFVLPPGEGNDFPLGQPLVLQVSPGTPVEKLMKKIFADRITQIGMVVINGRVAEGSVPLAAGDRVDVFEILGGG